MKKITILKICLFSGTFLLILAGCGDQDKKAGGSPENQTSDRGIVYTDTVPMDSAIANIKHYVASCKGMFGDRVPIRSYSINKSDIFGILGVTSVPDCEFDHCRVYIGLTWNNKFKLYMTPTALKPDPGSPKDSIYRDEIPVNPANGSRFLYDLNAPCPSTCDKYSPLYN